MFPSSRHSQEREKEMEKTDRMKQDEIMLIYAETKGEG